MSASSPRFTGGEGGPAHDKSSPPGSRARMGPRPHAGCFPLPRVGAQPQAGTEAMSTPPLLPRELGLTPAAVSRGAFGTRPLRSRPSVCSWWTFNKSGQFPQSKVIPLPGWTLPSDSQGLCVICVPGCYPPPVKRLEEKQVTRFV